MSSSDSGDVYAVPLVKIDDEGLQACEEGLSALEQFGDGPANLLAIVGKARTGKSFFCNYLLGQEAFEADNGGPCTTGVDVFSAAIPITVLADRFGLDITDGPCVGLVDVEGQGDRGAEYDMKLMVSTLLSAKVSIFNVKGFGGKTDLLITLGTLSKVGRSMVQRAHKNSCIFGHLHLLLRDYQLKLTTEEIKEYLFGMEDDTDMNLAEEEACAERNKIRRFLTESFRSIDIHTVPSPATSDVLAAHRSLPLEEVSEDFKAAVKQMMGVVVGQLKEPTEHNGMTLNGPRLGSLFASAVDMTNEGSVKMLDVFAAMEVNDCKEATQRALALFASKLKKKFKRRGSVLPPDELSEACEEAREEAVSSFEEHLGTEITGEVREEHRTALEERLSEAVQLRVKDNAARLHERRGQIIDDMDRKVDERMFAEQGKLPVNEEMLAFLSKSARGELHQWLAEACEAANLEAALQEDMRKRLEGMLDTRLEGLRIENDGKILEVAAQHDTLLETAKGLFTTRITALLNEGPQVPRHLGTQLEIIKAENLDAYTVLDPDTTAAHLEEFERHVDEEIARCMEANKTNVTPVLHRAQMDVKTSLKNKFTELQEGAIPGSRARLEEIRDEYLQSAKAEFEGHELFPGFAREDVEAFWTELSTIVDGHVSRLNKVAVFCDEKGVCKRGMLHKNGAKKLFVSNPWDYRYFVLTRESLSYYASSEAAEGKAKGEIPLSAITDLQPTTFELGSKKNANAFDIITEGRTYTLFGGSPEESDSWFSAISLLLGR